MELSERAALGKFLRSRRNEISPEQVGITPQGRRHTKGLCREEVAYLAGVSLTWYTWMEQGRAINFSSEVLESVLRALQTEPHEKRYAFELCGLPFELDDDEFANLPSLRRLVDYQPSYPAFIIERCWNVLHINQSAKNLYVGFCELPEERRNMLWYIFTCQHAKNLLSDWEMWARAMLSDFRADCCTAPDDPWFEQFVNDLRAASPEFNAWWGENDIYLYDSGEQIFDHPIYGKLAFYQHHLKPIEAPNVKVIFHVPLTD